MSIPNNGSQGGTQGQYIRIGLEELVNLQRAIFDLAMTMSATRSRIHSAEQTMLSLVSSVEALKEKGPDIDTPEESTSESSSSTTEELKEGQSPWLRAQWMLSPSGTWEYKRVGYTAPRSLTPRSISLTGWTPRSYSQPSTTTELDSKLTAQWSEHFGTGWYEDWSGPVGGEKTWQNSLWNEDEK